MSAAAAWDLTKVSPSDNSLTRAGMHSAPHATSLPSWGRVRSNMILAALPRNLGRWEINLNPTPKTNHSVTSLCNFISSNLLHLKWDDIAAQITFSIMC